MKEIKKYIKGKKNTYLVTIDNEVVTFYDDIVIQYELLLKKKISEIELEQIKKDNASLESYYLALALIARKMRTTKEINDYLKNKGFNSEEINKTIIKLTNSKALNDEYYVKIFLQDALRLNLDGPHKLKRKLESLGIKEEIYQIYFEQIEDNLWDERIAKIINKKQMANHHDSFNRWCQKLTSYLLQNGYEIERIKRSFSQLEEKDNPDLIKKEKEKLERKLAHKYEGESLNFQIKQKLYQKGFKKEDIDHLE